MFKLESKTQSQDFFAGIVVFFVALPLSLGIALASGASPQSGLVAAIVGGILVGALSGTPLQVSGPAAGLTVMVFGYIEHFGLPGLFMITAVAGLLQIALGVLGVAPLMLAVPPAVIQAMLAGIGVLIALGQLHVVLGFDPSGSAWGNLARLPEHLVQLNWGAFMVGIITLIAIYGWPKFKSSKLQMVPASVVAILAGTITSFLLPGPEIPRIHLEANLMSGFLSLSVPDQHYLEIGLAALALTVVASAESLLCAIATDKLHSGARSELNKELIAQGTGNLVSGVLGGLPITGVIVRSAANIASGAKSRMSAIWHGVFMLLSALFLVRFVNMIPKAALAALLVTVGIKLVKVYEIRKLARFNEGIVYFATIIGVIALNLLWGIGLGILFSVGFLLWSMARIELVTEGDAQSMRVRIRGALSFIAVPQLRKKLRELPDSRSYELQIETTRLDFAAIDAIRDWKTEVEKAGKKVFKPQLESLFDSFRQTLETKAK